MHRTQSWTPLSHLPPELNDGMLGLDGFFSGLSVPMIIADGRRFGHALHQDIFTVEVSTFACVSSPTLGRCSGWVVLCFSGTSVPTLNSGVGGEPERKKKRQQKDKPYKYFDYIFHVRYIYICMYIYIYL